MTPKKNSPSRARKKAGSNVRSGSRSSARSGSAARTGNRQLNTGNRTRNTDLTRRQFLKTTGVAAAGVGAAAMGLGGVAQAVTTGATLLPNTPDEVRIYRDNLGIPFIYSDTDYGLYYGLGYITAQDRLVQTEFGIRATRGRLAELMGEDYLEYDIFNRTMGMPYTDAELEEQFDCLTEDVQKKLEAMRDGFNQYLEEAETDPSKKPFEYYALYATPFDLLDGREHPRITLLDLVAYGVYVTFIDGLSDAEEWINAILLDYLYWDVFGGDWTAAYGVFNDLLCMDDPAAFTTIPSTQGRAAWHKPDVNMAMEQIKHAKFENLEKMGKKITFRDVKEKLRELGVPLERGSYAIGIHKSLTSDYRGILIAGPQSGYTGAGAPSYEVQLMGGPDNLKFRGPVYGYTINGYSDNVAFIATKGGGDNNDYYMDVIAGYDGDGNPTHYLFPDPDNPGAGPVPIPFEVRDETFHVARGGSRTIPIYRTVHGPVFDMEGFVPGIAITWKHAFWMKEYQSIQASLDWKSKDIHEGYDRMKKFVENMNFIGVDRTGNLGYAFVGLFPNRSEGIDPRLPLSGIGNMEWVGTTIIKRSDGTLTWEGGTYQSDIHVINPSQGWAANWNSKPCVDAPLGTLYVDWFKGRGHDEALVKAINHVLTTKKKFYREDAKWMVMELARRKGSLVLDPEYTDRYGTGYGTNMGYPVSLEHLKPYLLNVLPDYPDGSVEAQAKAEIEAYEGIRYDNPMDPELCGGSAAETAGNTILTKWFFKLTDKLFMPYFEPLIFHSDYYLGGWYIYSGLVGGLLVHVLDDAFGEGSTVPSIPSIDYFNGQDPSAVIVEAFNEALADLESEFGIDPSQWRRPREEYTIYNRLGYPVGSVYQSNRADANFSVFMGTGSLDIDAENLFNMGQSNFLKINPPYQDQYDLWESDELIPGWWNMLLDYYGFPTPHTNGQAVTLMGWFGIPNAQTAWYIAEYGYPPDFPEGICSDDPNIGLPFHDCTNYFSSEPPYPYIPDPHYLDMLPKFKCFDFKDLTFKDEDYFL